MALTYADGNELTVDELYTALADDDEIMSKQVAAENGVDV